MSDAIEHIVFGRMFDVGTDAHFIVDRANGGIVSANVRVASLLGRTVDSVLGTAFAKLAYEPRDVFCDGRYDGVALRRADGRPVLVRLDVVNIPDVEPGRDVVVVTARDPSEHTSVDHPLVADRTSLLAAHAALMAENSKLRQIQAELETWNYDLAVLAYRAGVTELVGSIAHHLNNPLGALQSTIRAVDKQIAELPPEHRGELDRRIRRITNIAGQIETNVNAIVTASRSSKHTALPPQVTAAIDSPSYLGGRITPSSGPAPDNKVSLGSRVEPIRAGGSRARKTTSRVQSRTSKGNVNVNNGIVRKGEP